MTTIEVTRQTKVKDMLRQQVKTFASQNQMYLKEVYERALRTLIHYRRKLEEQGKSLVYLVSPQDGTTINITLSVGMARKVKAISSKDKVSDRRILYTALILYAKKHQIDEIGFEETA